MPPLVRRAAARRRAAAATLITLPVLLIAQRHIVSELTFGAVKQ